MRNRSSASDFAYSHPFLCRVVFRLSLVCTHSYVVWSVICHLCAPCLNRLMDLRVVWQVQLWCPMTRCVRRGPWPPRGRGDLGA